MDVMISQTLLFLFNTVLLYDGCFCLVPKVCLQMDLQGLVDPITGGPTGLLVICNNNRRL